MIAKPAPADGAVAGGTMARVLVSDVVALAVASVAAYSVALRYDRAFLGYYGIPADGATLTKSGVFLALGGVFAPFLIALIGFQETVLGAKGSGRRFIAAIGLFAFVGIYPAVIYDDTRVRVTGLILVAVVGSLLAVSFSQLKHLGFLLESPLWLVLVIGVSALIVAPIYGAGAASAKQTYLVLRTRPTFAVVRIENDRLIAVQFNGNRLTGNLLIQAIGDGSITEFRTVHTGRLHQAPDSTTP